MRSEWRMWPDALRKSWKTTSDATAHVVYQLFGGDRVEHDEGLRGPKEFTYLEFPADDTVPYYVIEADHTGADLSPRITAVHIIARSPNREVRTRDLRDISLEGAMESAIEHAFSEIAMPVDQVKDPAELAARPLTEVSMRKRVQGLRKRARRKLTHERLERVARVYRENLDTGAPTKAVREEFDVSPATASIYVKAAREAGLLEHPPSSASSTPDSTEGRR